MVFGLRAISPDPISWCPSLLAHAGIMSSLHLPSPHRRKERILLFGSLDCRSRRGCCSAVPSVIGCLLLLVPSRVVIDNDVCTTATLIKVDSARKSGVLLEAVQALNDLNLLIKKAYISSDGRWFMDVFHVTDQFGEKLVDESIRTYIEQVPNNVFMDEA